MEARRAAEDDAAARRPFRRGWCLGSEAFKKQMLELMDGSLGESHSGEIDRETAEQKAHRIIAQAMARAGWEEPDLACGLKHDPRKLAIAARLRKETTRPSKWIAARHADGHGQERPVHAASLEATAWEITRHTTPVPTYA